MKTVFIVNPKAGLGTRFEKTYEALKSTADCEVYITKGPLDGQRYVSDYIKENGEARFIACGGDGTYNEVLNGVMEAGMGEVGVMPIGSGNDFCRNFGSRELFLHPQNLISGNTRPCDVIRYSLINNGERRTGYCANMINVGFDCAVADTTDKVKSKTFLSGSLAYFVSIFINLIKKTPSYLSVEADGKEIYNGEVLLTSAANGCYCGGGLKTNPLADVSDGYINLNIVKNVSRLKCLSVLPQYINGTYADKGKLKEIVSSKKLKNIKITPLNKKMRVAVDGEILDADKLELEIIENGYRFVTASAVSLEKIKEEIV